MNKNKAFAKFKNIRTRNNSILCTGIDPDPLKINKLYNFNGAKKESKIKAIKDFCIDLIESTSDNSAAYKINFAFFEQFGPEGYKLIEEIKSAIPKDIFTIADAKRGDIGNTAKAYATSIFDYFEFDSVTVNPYMGSDTIEPFLKWDDRITIILALTSNPGSMDFQMKKIAEQELYLHLTGTFANPQRYTNQESIAFVYGATNASYISKAREIAPNNLLLVPGVGAQGGDASSVIKSNSGGPLLINVSRGVSYPVNTSEDITRDKLKELINLNSKKYKDLFNGENLE